MRNCKTSRRYKRPVRYTWNGGLLNRSDSTVRCSEEADPGGRGGSRRGLGRGQAAPPGHIWASPAAQPGDLESHRPHYSTPSSATQLPALRYVIRSRMHTKAHGALSMHRGRRRRGRWNKVGPVRPVRSAGDRPAAPVAHNLAPLSSVADAASTPSTTTICNALASLPVVLEGLHIAPCQMAAKRWFHRAEA